MIDGVAEDDAKPDEAMIRQRFDDLYQRGLEVRKSFHYELARGTGEPSDWVRATEDTARLYELWIAECSREVGRYRPDFNIKFRNASDLTKSIYPFSEGHDRFVYEDRVESSMNVLKELAEAPLS